MAGRVFTSIREARRTLRRSSVDHRGAGRGLVAGFALLPPVAAGLILFRVVALEMLAAALIFAVAGHLAARLSGLPVVASLVPPAVIGVAMVGPKAPLAWPALVAALAVTGELARGRFAPNARIQVGIAAYALVLLVSWGGAGAPVVASWPGSVADPVQLYVGNVPGPVFATSLLGVIVGAAWLWYARRLSLLVILTFLAGALVPIGLLGWSAGYLLLSGPLWFAAALVLADRDALPASPVGRPLLGLVAGAIALTVRSRGVEGTLLTVGTLQLLIAGGRGGRWLLANRREVRARLRDPQRRLPPATT